MFGSSRGGTITGSCNPMVFFKVGLSSIVILTCNFSYAEKIPDKIFYVTSIVGAPIKRLADSDFPDIGLFPFGSELSVLRDGKETFFVQKKDCNPGLDPGYIDLTYENPASKQSYKSSSQLICEGWVRKKDVAGINQFKVFNKSVKSVSTLLTLPSDRSEGPKCPDTELEIETNGTYTHRCYQCEECEDINAGCDITKPQDPEGNYLTMGQLYIAGNLVWADNIKTMLYLNSTGLICAFRSEQINERNFDEQSFYENPKRIP